MGTSALRVGETQQDSLLQQPTGNNGSALSQRERLDLVFRHNRVIRRTGQVVPFDSTKIDLAVTAAFKQVGELPGKEDRDAAIKQVTCRVLAALFRNGNHQNTAFAIEDIQDQVELALARNGHHAVAAAYSKYRENHAERRRAKAMELVPEQFSIIMADGKVTTIHPETIRNRLERACQGLAPQVDCDQLLARVVASLHSGILEETFDRALVLEASTLIEQHPDYSFVAARLLLDNLIHETTGKRNSSGVMSERYADHLVRMVGRGIQGKRLNPQLQTTFDLQRLGQALRAERDLQFGILGLQTLYDRYFVKVDGKRIEMPQAMWMRVAMGLALNEDQPTDRAIEFYEILSSFRFMNSTPTLFNSGTTFPQMSSCYLSTVKDDLASIFEAISDNAMLAKFSGGLGNDWTPVRALGSNIQSTGGKSQGVVPFLRVVNDTAIAVNQGGKRKGAVCCYLETWHRDIEEFISLRKATGDERRRTHDMNTANWVPDLFMQRMHDDAHWTLFSPADVPDLHDKYGRAFATAYEAYEARFEAGELPGKRINALDLWKDMLRMLFETGHPWITFKDPCNIRSPQQHVGVVHSSNLCTEITLNTSADEIAVCNLGSINLARHLDRDAKLDQALLANTVRTAMRMLDNVIDLNYYSVAKARNSNMQHRPVGLGQVGYHDCLCEMGIGFDTDEAVEFADLSSELIAYHAYHASSDLAVERGAYASFPGSLWDRGIMPLDSLRMLARERNGGKDVKPDPDGWLRCPGLEVNMQQHSTLDWDILRKKIQRDGMRNSNCLAIAPTATIGNIMGASACIEPPYKNIYTKSNLSGEFKILNRHMVNELLDAGLWDDAMISELKVNDGELQNIKRIPAAIRARHKTAFNIDFRWLIDAASRRQKWIDQSQSLNLFIDTPSGKRLMEMYSLAWRRGLKTTYYCRSTQASSTEKFTTQNTGNLNNVVVERGPTPPAACALEDPDCEACQ